MAHFAPLLEALAALPQTQGTPQLSPIGGPPPFTPNPAGMGDFDPPELMQFPMPQAPPPAPSMPFNPDIIRQYQALVGPPPTPPTQAPIGTLGRIALALQGLGAGVQGQGPQFLAALRRQQEEPQKEYERQLYQYNREKTQSGLAGLQAAQSAEERRQAQKTAEADRQFNLLVAERARRLGFNNSVAIEKLKDALETERQAK